MNEDLSDAIIRENSLVPISLSIENRTVFPVIKPGITLLDEQRNAPRNPPPIEGEVFLDLMNTCPTNQPLPPVASLVHVTPALGQAPIPPPPLTQASYTNNSQAPTFPTHPIPEQKHRIAYL